MANELRLFRGRRLKTFLAFADRILPPEGDQPGAGTMETARLVDHCIFQMRPEIPRLLRVFLIVFEWFGIVFGLRGFSNLSPARQERQMRWFENNPIPKLRLGFFGLKTFVWYGYYNRTASWAAIGYSGPRVDRPFPDATLRDLEGPLP